MEILTSILVCIIGILFGAVGVLAGIIRSDQNKADKQKAEMYDIEKKAQQKVNEEKKKNEEKIQNAHGTPNLSNAECVIDLLHQ